MKVNYYKPYLIIPGAVQVSIICFALSFINRDYVADRNLQQQK
jgi:hypothetical protein